MADDGGKALQALTRALQEALGGDLVTVMLYGSTARQAAVPGRSDLDVLLVVRDASAGSLQRLGPALGAWAREGHAPPLIQSERDWKASADVFPLEVEDIREAHRVLAGVDVTAGVQTSRANQRIELEREARGKLIRLRAEYAVAAGDGALLAELLARATGTFLALFRGALRVAGRPVPSAPRDVVRAAASAAGFDPAPFEWALEARATVPAKALKAGDPLAGQYLDAVQAFVGWVDGL